MSRPGFDKDEFESAVDRLSMSFISNIVDLASHAARDVVGRAFKKRERRRRQARIANDAIDPARAVRDGLAPLVDDFERRCIVNALRKHDGNITNAAEALRTTRQSLQRKIRRLNVVADVDPQAPKPGRRRTNT